MDRRRRFRSRPGLLILTAGALAVAAGSARAADPQPGPPLTIQRAPGPIEVDGEVREAEWQGVTPVTTWFETRVGDNVEPQVKNLGFLAYDDQYFYAGFVFDDPLPGSVRAPLGDHDAMPGSTDYAGVIIDGRNDGKTAQMFLANARGVQYDAMTSDASGEDSAPDFFWDAAGRITETGWSLEIRIPFSSLRYAHGGAAPTWGILLYRNYPRDRRYQFFSARLPRDVNCFICNSSKLSGLAQLPRGSHLVVAPFVTGSQSSAPDVNLSPGSPLVAGDFESEAGVDVKWGPSAALTLDGTINPDFSQIESDVAQIAANERFALFFPEKRPFFLEGVDLLATPFPTTYTRTITSPRAGGRATGRIGSTSYTGLYTQDRGGGSVILPGPQGSDFADQDFVSDVWIGRVRRDFGRSYVSLLGTGREVHDDGGGGYNRVFGPDFQWRPRAQESINGQFLWSETRTPNRTDLTSQWDGRQLSAGAGLLYWSHGTAREDWYIQYQALGDDFRADNGFIPQVGYSEIYFDGGYTIRPDSAFFNRVRFFVTTWYDADTDHNLLSRRVGSGIAADGAWNSFIRVELNQDGIRVGDQVLDRLRPRVIVEASPSRLFSQFLLDASFGQEIDFANAREGSGVSVTGGFALRPGNHLELRPTVSWRWLDVDAPGGGTGRLFTAQVERLRATWTFNSRAFVRLIGQYVETVRDPSLYLFPGVPAKDASFTGSALLAYKLNWQTVFYLGYGGEHLYTPFTEELEENSREFFAKASYAWQH